MAQMPVSNTVQKPIFASDMPRAAAGAILGSRLSIIRPVSSPPPQPSNPKKVASMKMLRASCHLVKAIVRNTANCRTRSSMPMPRLAKIMMKEISIDKPVAE